jgi:hypothetical protein
VANYLLIESRDPFESNDVASYSALAAGLLAEGHAVTLFLVQNGVLPARAGVASEGLSTLVAKGARVLADDFSLRERGIPVGRLASGVQAAPLDVIVDQLAAGSKTLWH